MNSPDSGERSRDIRAREVRFHNVTPDDLHLDELQLRLRLRRGNLLAVHHRRARHRRIPAPLAADRPRRSADELAGAAMIREVHVYGQSVEIGEAADGRAQHAGLGTRLIERAAEIARERGYQRLAVISAVGTRGYYRKRGFSDGLHYQSTELL